MKVGAGLLLELDACLLLLERATEPFEGRWSLPSGYVEAKESPARAAERELQEELHLDAESGELFGVYFFDDDPRGSGIFIVYTGELKGGHMVLSDENSAVRTFKAGELLSLAGGGHDQAVSDWLSRREVSER